MPYCTRWQACRSHETSLVGDVVLGYRGGKERGTLFVARTAATECLDRGLRLPTFEDVDSARLKQIGRQREVETSRRPACLSHHLDASRQVVVAFLRVDHDVSSDDHHESLLHLCERTTT